MKLWKIWVISAVCIIIGACLNILYYSHIVGFNFTDVVFLIAWSLLALPLMFAKEFMKNTDVVIDWKR